MPPIPPRKLESFDKEKLIDIILEQQKAVIERKRLVRRLSKGFGLLIGAMVIVATIGQFIIALVQSTSQPPTPQPPVTPQTTLQPTPQPSAQPQGTPTPQPSAQPPSAQPQATPKSEIIPVDSKSQTRGYGYEVRETGEYTFTYYGGAFLSYAKNTQPDCNPECWSGNLVAFVSREPAFGGDCQVDRTKAIFVWWTTGNLPNQTYDTEAGVQAEFARKPPAKKRLNKGDFVIFIVMDCKGNYSDNEGYIRVKIEYSP